MLGKIMAEIKETAKLPKSRRDKQLLINAGEVGLIWDILSARYDTKETTRVYLDFAQDTDLKFILEQGHKFLLREIDQLEKLAVEYGIPSPMKPPASPLSVVDTEVVSDRFIFRQVFAGIQSFLPILMVAFTRSLSCNIREIFRVFLYDEMKLYNEFLVYGLAKGWVSAPPAYRM